MTPQGTGKARVFYAVHAADSCPKHNCCVCEEPTEQPTKQGACAMPDPLWGDSAEDFGAALAERQS
jgi:hypothetical protein